MVEYEATITIDGDIHELIINFPSLEYKVGSRIDASKSDPIIDVVMFLKQIAYNTITMIDKIGLEEYQIHFEQRNGNIRVDMSEYADKYQQILDSVNIIKNI